MSASPVVRLRDLRLRRGMRTVLDGVSLEVSRGQVVALMGASGSGKTTTLRAMAGLEPFEGGEVDVDGVVLAAGAPVPATVRRLRTKVGMVFQFHCLFEHLTAMQNVCLAQVHVHGRSPAEAEVRARELLCQLGVEHRAGALPRELSGGEAQRVAIARALATEPEVLLLDEPTSALDPRSTEDVVQVIEGLREKGMTLVMVTHQLELARRLGDRVVEMGSATEASE